MDRTSEGVSRRSIRLRVLGACGAIIAAFVIGSVFGRPVAAVAASSIGATIKNWPKMPWQVAVASTPAKTPVSAKCAADIAVSDWYAQSVIYTVPSGQYLTVTGVSMDAEMLKTDGRIDGCWLESGDYRLNIAPVMLGEFNSYNLRKYACSQNTEWRLPPNSVITAAIDRDTPGASGLGSHFYLTGYLTTRP